MGRAGEAQEKRGEFLQTPLSKMAVILSSESDTPVSSVLALPCVNCGAVIQSTGFSGQDIGFF